MKKYALTRVSKLAILLLAALFVSPLGNAAATPIDNQQGAGITITPTSGLITTEAGGTASFKVALNTRPGATVTIDLSSSDPSEGTISTTRLIFRTSNWFYQRTITVTGVDDQILDRDVPFQIITAPARSNDPVYDDRDAEDVSVTNQDNESGAIIINPTSNLVTTEEGAPANFTIVLSDPPTETVAVELASSDGSEASISPTQMTFSPSNWSTARTATISGIDDQLDDGDQPFTIFTSSGISTDSAYDGVAVPDVTGVNRDNDFRPDSVNDIYQTNANPNQPLVINAPGVLANDTDKNNDLLNAILISPPQKGTLVLNVDGSFVYTPSQPYSLLETDSFSYVANDGLFDSKEASVEIIIDPITPTISWVGPVQNGEIYTTVGQLVKLEAAVVENYSIEAVRFFRWDANRSTYVDIGTVTNSPYELEFDTSSLNILWNQIFTTVRDGAGNESVRQFIWIYRSLPFKLYMPKIAR